MLKARVYTKLQNFTEALHAIERVNTAEVDRSDYLKVYSLVLFENNRRAECLEALEEFI